MKIMKTFQQIKAIILKHIAEIIIDPIIKFINLPIASVAGYSENMEKAILRPVIKSYSKHSKINIIQYTTFPKKLETISVEWTEGQKFVDYAIILQGPIRSKEHFTVDTVKYYKKCYPGASIIVSTWPGMDEISKIEIQKLGAYWVENQVPDIPGAGNINMQLTSSLEGMKKAKILGCKYAVKTRTDQRIYANDVLQYFRNLQETFPSKNPEIVSERLIYISYGSSYRFLAFNLCDFVVFGETNELIKLYSIQKDNRPNDFFTQYEIEIRKFKASIHDGEVKSLDSPYELDQDYEKKFYKFMISEANIVYHYFIDNICSLNPGDDLLDAYLSYLKDYAIVADSEKLLLYWPKYSVYTAQYHNELSFYGRMDFKKWLDIYLHYQPKRNWSMPTHISKEGKENR